MTACSDKYMKYIEEHPNVPRRIVEEEHSIKVSRHKGRKIEIVEEINGKPDYVTIIYRNDDIEAHLIRGLIRDKWLKAGGVQGLGYPQTDETKTTDHMAVYNKFENGYIYFVNGRDTEAFILSRGPIYNKWKEVNEVDHLGYPTTDEEIVGRKGRYNNFQSADPSKKEMRAIYWHPTIDAHVVRGAIWYEWRINRGGITGLGYPITDEEKYVGKNGRTGHISSFQKGVIIYDGKEEKTSVSYEEVGKFKMYSLLNIIIALGIILGGFVIYAVLTKKYGLILTLFPIGVVTAYIETKIVDYLFRTIGRKVADLLQSDSRGNL